MRKVIISLFLAGIFLGGCQTVKYGVGGTVKGLADDTYNAWQAIKKADAWMRENAW